MKSNLRIVFALVMACFFVSGVAGLVYQVAWARYLALFLGHTSYAVVAVLVAFMGGLAIGNAVLGAAADRVERPLALYGWLEIGIAAYAIAFPWYFQFCHDLYIGAARQFSGGTPLLLLKFLFSFATVVIPTTLMGATFPALTRFVTRSLAELRGRVASLYFINSLGAVFGCFAADFWWLPSIGLELTVYAAAALNCLAGVIALVMSRAILEGSPTSIAAPSPNANITEEYFSALDLKVATIAIGCSGFVAMLYEVAWTRLLALALGSSTHAFSIMLITFITGIAVGAAIVAKATRLKRTMDAFGWAEIALAATVFASMFSYELLPYWFARAARLLARTPEAYPLYELTQGLICFGVMFIPAICLGMTLPFASRIATAELAKTGKSVGKIFAINTLGTVLGAAVTGLWVMPNLNLAGTFAIGVALNAAIGAAILYRAALLRLKGPVIGTAVVGVAMFVWIMTAWFDGPWKNSFCQGIWRKRNALGTLAEYRNETKAFPLLYYKDGAGSSVSVLKHVTNPNVRTLRVNGKTDASIGDSGTQLLLGHLPCLLHTKATNALVIGFGSGMTASAILRHTNIVHAQVVEISPEVIEASQFFAPYNGDILKNRRLSLAVEDAKTFLKTTPERFGVVVSEPSNPWMAGVASVFTAEFYQSCAARMTTDGVMVQWVQVYETSDETLQTVIKTFTSVFPFMSLWRSQEGDLILVGSVNAMNSDVDSFLRRLATPEITADLRRGGLGEPMALLSRELISQRNGAFLPLPDAPLHSDYFPTLEYMSQVGFFVGSGSTFYEAIAETLTPRAETLLSSYLKQHPLKDEDFRRIGNAILENQFTDSRLTLSLMQRWAEADTNSTLPLEMIERIGVNRSAASAEELRLAPRHQWIIQQATRDIELLHFYERVLMQSYRSKRTVFWVPDTTKLQEVLNILRERDPNFQRVHNLHLSELAWDRGDDEGCLKFAQMGLDPDVKKYGPLRFTLDEIAPRFALYHLIEMSIRKGDLRQARNLAEQVRAGGYLEPGEFFFAPLAFVYRKAVAMTDPQPGAAK